MQTTLHYFTFFYYGYFGGVVYSDLARRPEGQKDVKTYRVCILAVTLGLNSLMAYWNTRRWRRAAAEFEAAKQEAVTALDGGNIAPRGTFDRMNAAIDKTDRARDFARFNLAVAAVISTLLIYSLFWGSR